MSICALDIDLLEGIKYTKPRKIDNIYYSDISYNNKPFIIQIDKLIINENLENISKDSNPSIEFKVNPENIDVYEFFIGLDEKNIEVTYNNSTEWFSKQLSEVIIDDMYKRISKPIKKNYEPNIKFKLPIKSGKIACNIYDQNKELVNINTINEGTNSIILLHISPFFLSVM